jgi:hypothetical protein
MTVRFTEQEWENIDKIPFAWRISPNCPEKVRKTLEPKLKLFYKETGHINNPTELSDERPYIIE